MFKRKRKNEDKLELRIEIEGALSLYAKGDPVAVVAVYDDFLDRAVIETAEPKAPFKVGFNKADVEELEAETTIDPDALELEDDFEDED